MATRIRLRRMGAKKAPFYRVVVADSRSPRDGRFIEEIGYYDPTKNPSIVKIDEERAKYWLGTGAQPSETVRSLMEIVGISPKTVYKQVPQAKAAVAEDAGAEAETVVEAEAEAEAEAVEVADEAVETEAAAEAEPVIETEAEPVVEAESEAEEAAEAGQVVEEAEESE